MPLLQPKYIKGLLNSAAHRKLEYERQIERKAQREREAEGEEFADKDAFVTTAYPIILVIRNISLIAFERSENTY